MTGGWCSNPWNNAVHWQASQQYAAPAALAGGAAVSSRAAALSQHLSQALSAAAARRCCLCTAGGLALPGLTWGSSEASRDVQCSKVQGGWTACGCIQQQHYFDVCSHTAEGNMCCRSALRFLSSQACLQQRDACGRFMPVVTCGVGSVVQRDVQGAYAWDRALTAPRVFGVLLDALPVAQFSHAVACTHCMHLMLQSGRLTGCACMSPCAGLDPWTTLCVLNAHTLDAARIPCN